jgi:hypothetical protein
MGALSVEIAKARDTLQDEEASSYRIATAKFVGYANDFVKEFAVFRPDLFSTIGEITCTNDSVFQAAPTGAIVLMDIFQVKNGRIVREVKRGYLDSFSPSWMNDTGAAAKNWARHDKDPLRFFIYPKAPTAQILIGQWAVLPAAMADENAQIPAQVPEAYYPALHHYMVFRAEIKDDEYAVNGRAKLAYDSFLGLAGAGKATKQESQKPDKGAVGANQPA